MPQEVYKNPYRREPLGIRDTPTGQARTKIAAAIDEGIRGGVQQPDREIWTNLWFAREGVRRRSSSIIDERIERPPIYINEANRDKLAVIGDQLRWGILRIERPQNGLPQAWASGFAFFDRDPDLTFLEQ